MTNSGTMTISSGANRNDSIWNIRSSEPRNFHRPAAYAAGMPMTSETITAPPQLMRLVRIGALEVDAGHRVALVGQHGARSSPASG